MEIVVKVNVTVKAQLALKKYMDPNEIPMNHKQSNIARTRSLVTKYLYLSPNCRARSLSTLIAVSVSTDTPHKVQLDA